MQFHMNDTNGPSYISVCHVKQDPFLQTWNTCYMLKLTENINSGNENSPYF